MSSGLDTVTRRQLRKAFGGDALKVLEAHEQGLLQHAAAIRKLDSDIGTTAAKTATEAVRLTEVLRRPFWGRLRWLLRGK